MTKYLKGFAISIFALLLYASAAQLSFNLAMDTPVKDYSQISRADYYDFCKLPGAKCR